MHRYPYIDILRGIAALLVIWYHVIENSGWGTFPSAGLAMLPRAGWIGVDLFLVISGFVIGKATMEAHAATPDWRPAFIARRARRIVPLYGATSICYLFLVSPDILRHGWDSVGHVLSHVLFIHNLWPSTSGSINGPNWSVALEVQFYLLMVLLTPWLARTAGWRVLMAWIAVALTWRYATTLIWIPGHSDVNTQRVAATQLPGSLDQFAFGVCLAKLAISGHLQFRPWRFALAASIAALALTATSLVFWLGWSYWSTPAIIVLWRTVLSAGFAGLLACVVMVPWSPGWLSWPSRYLGEISYGLYLWHLPVLMTLLDKTPWQGYRLLWSTMLLTVILAALSWHGFEKLNIQPRQRVRERLPALSPA